MKTLKILLALVILAVVVVILVYNRNDSVSKVKKVISEADYNIKNRQWITKIFTYVNQYDVVGKIARLSRDEDYTWLVDSNSDKILEYNNSGILTEEFGQQGPAPWENSSIWFFNKIGNYYYTMDFSKNAIRKHKVSNDSLLTYYKGEDRLGNCAMLAGDNFVVRKKEVDNFGFEKVDLSDSSVVRYVSIREEILNEFGYFPTKNVGLVFEGNFASNQNGIVLYYFYKMGAFVLLDQDLNLLKIVRTIDGMHEVPRGADKDYGNGIVAHGIEPDVFINYSGSINEDYVFILSNVLTPKEKGNRVIDVYSLKDYSYVGSYNPDKVAEQVSTNIAVGGNKISVLYDNMTVANYEFLK